MKIGSLFFNFARNPGSRVAAILEDNRIQAETVADVISGRLRIQTRIYETCRQLTNDIPLNKFVVYIVDYKLSGGVLGTECIPRIRKLHQEAHSVEPLILLASADNVLGEAKRLNVDFIDKNLSFFDQIVNILARKGISGR